MPDWARSFLAGAQSQSREGVNKWRIAAATEAGAKIGRSFPPGASNRALVPKRDVLDLGGMDCCYSAWASVGATC